MKKAPIRKPPPPTRPRPSAMTALDRRMLAEHTRSRPLADDDNPGNFLVSFTTGAQEFTLDVVADSQEAADWWRCMLAKALTQVVRREEARCAST